MPLFPQDARLNNCAPQLYQTYNQMLNMTALSSMILASQEQALRSQINGMLQMRNQLLMSRYNASQCISQVAEPLMMNTSPISLSTKSNSAFSPKDYPLTPEQEKLETFYYDQQMPRYVAEPTMQPSPKKLKAQLEEMIYFLMNNIGKIDQSEIEKARRKYANNVYLLPIFDNLTAKFLPVKKHREDIIRYVIRRAFKFFKSKIIKEEKIYGKRAYAALCKKYFQFTNEELVKMGVNTEDEKELIEFLLPYRKNSKNRTMNSNFTSELFASQEFCNDYKQFLDNFETVIVQDNNKKIKKLIALAEECIVKNCPEKIKSCTRLPWLQGWIEKTREVGFELLSSGLGGEEESAEKKIKTESSSCSDYYVNVKYEDVNKSHDW